MQRDQVVIASDLPANESGSIEPGHGHADMTTRCWDRGRDFSFGDQISPTIEATTRFCLPHADHAICQAVDHDQVPDCVAAWLSLFLSFALAVRSEAVPPALPTHRARVTSGIVISSAPSSLPLPLHHLLFTGL